MAGLWKRKCLTSPYPFQYHRKFEQPFLQPICDSGVLKKIQPKNLCLYLWASLSSPRLTFCTRLWSVGFRTSCSYNRWSQDRESNNLQAHDLPHPWWSTSIGPKPEDQQWLACHHTWMARLLAVSLWRTPWTWANPPGRNPPATSWRMHPSPENLQDVHTLCASPCPCTNLAAMLLPCHLTSQWLLRSPTSCQHQLGTTWMFWSTSPFSNTKKDKLDWPAPIHTVYISTTVRVGVTVCKRAACWWHQIFSPPNASLPHFVQMSWLCHLQKSQSSMAAVHRVWWALKHPTHQN